MSLLEPRYFNAIHLSPVTLHGPSQAALPKPPDFNTINVAREVHTLYLLAKMRKKRNPSQPTKNLWENNLSIGNIITFLHISAGFPVVLVSSDFTAHLANLTFAKVVFIDQV